MNTMVCQMDEKVIVCENITKDFGYQRGVFDVSFSVKRSEAFGFVGENGAGKTTIIRQIMGFVAPDKGKITIEGKDAFNDAPEIKKYVGYVPGEIALPPLKTGTEVLNSQMELLGIKDSSRADELIKELQLNIKAYPKRMSKGMKQKMALVMALMGDPDNLILDEPMNGLDPLMHNEFMDILLREKSRGKTILISSNSYDELETLCDTVALISKGRIVSVADVNLLKSRTFILYKIEFNNRDDYESFKGNDFFEITRIQEQYLQYSIKIERSNLNRLFEVLSDKDVKFIAEIPYDLETYLLETGKGEDNGQNE